MDPDALREPQESGALSAVHNYMNRRSLKCVALIVLIEIAVDLLINRGYYFWSEFSSTHSFAVRFLIQYSVAEFVRWIVALSLNIPV
jgi:hypothetical protein